MDPRAHSMDPRFPRLYLLIFLAFPVLSTDVQDLVDGHEFHSTSSPASLFVFGASLVDAGTNAVVMPHRSNAEFDPYGSDYFGRSVGRWSNGRTFMDIITQSLGLGFLDPFLQSIGSNFTHGVNFASSGSTAQNTSASSTTDSGGLFSLLVQVEQFREYQNSVLARQEDSRENLQMRKKFSNSIYFLETANNDYLTAGINTNHAEVVKLVMDSMRQALEMLYFLGARTFIVMNVMPLGCSPCILSDTINMRKDKYNCTIEWNEFVSMHNKNLGELLNELRSKYQLAEWILFDAYSIFLDGYQNPSNYGIRYPFQACCGVGGPYNFNSKLECGDVGKYINGTYMKAKKCKDPSLHLIWDGLHPVESFCKYIAQGVLDGEDAVERLPTHTHTHTRNRHLEWRNRRKYLCNVPATAGTSSFANPAPKDVRSLGRGEYSTNSYAMRNGTGLQRKRYYGKVPRATFYNYLQVIEELIIMMSLYM